MNFNDSLENDLTSDRIFFDTVSGFARSYTVNAGAAVYKCLVDEVPSDFEGEESRLTLAAQTTIFIWTREKLAIYPTVATIEIDGHAKPYTVISSDFVEENLYYSQLAIDDN